MPTPTSAGSRLHKLKKAASSQVFRKKNLSGTSPSQLKLLFVWYFGARSEFQRKISLNGLALRCDSKGLFPTLARPNLWVVIEEVRPGLKLFLGKKKKPQHNTVGEQRKIFPVAVTVNINYHYAVCSSERTLQLMTGQLLYFVSLWSQRSEVMGLWGWLHYKLLHNLLLEGRESSG